MTTQYRTRFLREHSVAGAVQAMQKRRGRSPARWVIRDYEKPYALRSWTRSLRV